MTQCTEKTMNIVFVRYYLLLVFVIYCSGDRGDYIGCYRINVDDTPFNATEPNIDACLSACEQLYYKYAMLYNGSTCYCENAPGQFRFPHEACNTTCSQNATCSEDNAASVFDTGSTAPGPPASIEIVNVTETTVRVKWTPPRAYSVLTGYILRANVLETYADFALPPLEWRVSNDTYHSQLLNLHPGSVYTISAVATNYDEEGPNITTIAETIIGTPDPGPPDIEQKERHGDRMFVHIPQAKNVNGPVTYYRIVVSIELYQQGYITDNLKNHSAATADDLPYYITAEIGPEDIEQDFIIGDRSTYNGFYNAPLPLTNDIDIFLGVVSEKNLVKKYRYADSSKKIILNINEPEEISPIMVALAAGIAIGVVLLLVGIGFLIILRKKTQLARLKRSSQTLPLSLSEPCVEIENAGFLQDEEERVDYYGNLKRKLWNIPRNLLDIDISCVTGLGSYGKFTRGKVQQHGAQTHGLVQVVADRELERPDKRVMLQELDVLIKCSEHENVISLIGICETSTTLFVVLQDTRQNLKEMLLQSRQRDIQNNKFSLLIEDKVLQICTDVARGMEYLHNKKIFHKRLACRNIAIGEGGVIKVAGFGLSHIRPLHETPDYTRWTSHEMLRQSRFNPKADVWAFGCLMWEVLTLGATPYSHTPNRDVAARVLRGMRPSQPSYVGDELFQLCLQCWQVDPDERPTFSSLLRELSPLSEASGTISVTFTHYNGFTYEPHVPQYEIIS